ncbi:hypothetical protein KIPB_001051, partial [Kipferlia bialata]|eukprot:g1051.t1
MTPVSPIYQSRWARGTAGKELAITLVGGGLFRFVAWPVICDSLGVTFSWNEQELDSSQLVLYALKQPLYSKVSQALFDPTHNMVSQAVMDQARSLKSYTARATAGLQRFAASLPAPLAPTPSPTKGGIAHLQQVVGALRPDASCLYAPSKAGPHRPIGQHSLL